MEEKGFEATRLSVNDFRCLRLANMHPSVVCFGGFLLPHCDKPSALAIIVFTPELFGLNADASLF